MTTVDRRCRSFDVGSVGDVIVAAVTPAATSVFART
jgi:hypothetical protein